MENKELSFIQQLKLDTKKGKIAYEKKISDMKVAFCEHIIAVAEKECKNKSSNGLSFSHLSFNIDWRFSDVDRVNIAEYLTNYFKRLEFDSINIYFTDNQFLSIDLTW